MTTPSTARPDGPAISVCLPATRSSTVGATVASILGQTWRHWELVVIGQGPQELLEPAVRAAARGDDRVRFVHCGARGLSVARNAGLAEARYGIIASLDDDCEARSDWLEVLASAFTHDPALGLIGGALLAPPKTARGPSSCLSIIPDEVLHEPAASPVAPRGFNWVGANFAIRRDATARIGRFDELLGAGGLFLSAEDNDYWYRLEAAGVRMLSTPRCVVSHTHGRRYGLKALVRYWQGQGVGRGAVLAKLTMRGDPRGATEVRNAVREYPSRWFARTEPGEGPRTGARRPQLLVSDAVRTPFLVKTYQHCLRHYELDPEGLLRRRSQ